MVLTICGDNMRFRRGRFATIDLLEIVSNAYNKEGPTTPPVEPVDEVKPVENDGVEKKKAGRPRKE